jgi:peptide/nickel transport system ATP-binding protein
VLNLLARLRAEFGMAMIFVTHDLAAARVVADRIAVMYLGRIVELGPSDEICAAPAHPYTKALLAAVPDLARRKVRLQGEPASALDPPTGCEFHPRCPMARPSCATDPAPLIALPGSPGRAVACPVHVAGLGGGKSGQA